MGSIVVGVAAFLMAGLSDWAVLRGWRALRRAAGLAAVLLWAYALYGVLFQSDRFWLPAALSYLGWPLLAAGMVLLVYSVFVEIPLRQTYAPAGPGSGLVSTGTYALCRHPGVLWFALVLLALSLVSRARLLVVAAPVWLLMDGLWVWWQDAHYLPHRFPGYSRYQQQTPMLVPTRDSLSACLRTFSAGPAPPDAGGAQAGSGRGDPRGADQEGEGKEPVL